MISKEDTLKHLKDAYIILFKAVLLIICFLSELIPTTLKVLVITVQLRRFLVCPLITISINSKQVKNNKINK